MLSHTFFGNRHRYSDFCHPTVDHQRSAKQFYSFIVIVADTTKCGNMRKKNTCVGTQWFSRFDFAFYCLLRVILSTVKESWLIGIANTVRIRIVDSVCWCWSFYFFFFIIIVMFTKYGDYWGTDIKNATANITNDEKLRWLRSQCIKQHW